MRVWSHRGRRRLALGHGSHIPTTAAATTTTKMSSACALVLVVVPSRDKVNALCSHAHTRVKCITYCRRERARKSKPGQTKYTKQAGKKQHRQLIDGPTAARVRAHIYTHTHTRSSVNKSTTVAQHRAQWSPAFRTPRLDGSMARCCRCWWCWYWRWCWRWAAAVLVLVVSLFGVWHSMRNAGVAGVARICDRV